LIPGFGAPHVKKKALELVVQKLLAMGTILASTDV